MIVVDCEQLSPDWHKARAGAITASMFSEVRKRVNALTDQQSQYVAAILAGADKATAAKDAGYKSAPKTDKIERALRGEPVGDFSNAAMDYAFRLAVERLSGQPLDEGGMDTFAMRRGRALEPEARDMHALAIGREIQPTGLVKTEDGKFGASADGLIDQDGGSEYKCLIAPDRLRSILIDKDLSEFKDQVQGCLWLTGRRWWHFCLYCPVLSPLGKDLTIHVVERDDDYIEALERDLLAFDSLVESYVAKLTQQDEQKIAA